ncbi:LysR substrate-binding domain-containing protein [Qingshengfaniella alkalisoli]|uniref:LysR family transcriptional regulator n=1 Tax=Qingshengfaniella alkalisoli TaxID=2599296 RepID=A0A5B8J038_9RHOB|nr:LysR substrate-binding domain-containing protein [Qingshengfaniella alkalisoli]QDY71274.1 LysR family transcriptional regulator [Qingshengfaniella alkalisoli]
MHYQQIRAFHLVAREGSVGRAAEIMGLSQPTVSQHLKGLEGRYGLRLFEKRGRGLALTETGRELANVTDRLMEQVDAIENILTLRPKSAAGRLRVVSDSPPIAVRIVRHLLNEHPDIDVSIRKASVDDAVEALMALRADVGVVVEPLVGTSLEILPFGIERLFACFPAGSGLVRNSVFPLELVSEQTIILREKQSRTRALIERAMGSNDLVPGRVIEIEGAEVVREAVANGLGISFFSESECPPDPRLGYAPVKARRGKTSFVEYVLLRRDRRHVPEIKAFSTAAQILRHGAEAVAKRD